MCKAWEDQRKEDLLKGRKEGRREGWREGQKEGAEEQRLVAIRNMLELGLPKEKILTKYTEEEYERAQNRELIQI